jgi:regulator of protease activity HflC (stomatin/prohibitin superfamily)
MKNMFLLSLLFATSACSYVSTEPNEEKVLNAKPWFFGSGGVFDTPVKGTELVAWSTSAITVNMQPEQHKLELNDLMTSDGVPLDFDASVVTQVTDSVALVKRYGSNWYDNNISTELLSYIRDAVKKHGLNETAISTTAAASIDAEVSERLEQYFARNKFPVRLVRFTIGRANPPDSVKDQRIATASQEQRVLTMQKTVLAEEQRKNAEAKRAEADRAYQNGLGLNADQFVQLRTLDTLKSVCGNKNCTFVQGTGGSLVNIK